MDDRLHIFSQIGSLVTCEYKYAGLGSWRTPPIHNHDGYEILIFLGGNARAFTEVTDTVLKKGDVLCVAPYFFHGVEIIEEETYERILINLPENLPDRLSSKDTNLNRCFSYEGDNKLPLIHLEDERLQELIGYCLNLEKICKGSGTAFGWELLRDSLITQILVMLGQECRKHIEITEGIMPQLVTDTFSYIQANIAEDNLIRKLSEYLHHNRTYIGRCFKKVTGVTVQQYIIAKRIALAQEQLKQGEFPTQVCFACGFNNYANFSRTFIDKVGVSPKEYRKRYQIK